VEYLTQFHRISQSVTRLSDESISRLVGKRSSARKFIFVSLSTMPSLAGFRKHWAFFGLLSLAIGFHLPIFGDALNPDATTYLAVAKSIVTRGSLEIETTLVPRHPPLMPLLVTPFGLTFGFNEMSVHLLELLAFVILLSLTYSLSKGFGPRFSLVPSILLSLDPVLYLNMSDGRALCILMILALSTLVAIWRGLDDSRWLILAAATASLAYLTADSIGYLFPIAGIVGLGWRFYYVRWKVFQDPWYLSAMAIFSSTVFLWTGYNVASQGSIYTDPRVVGYIDRLFGATHWDIQIVLVSGLFVYFGLYLGQNLVPFLALREVRAAVRSLPSRVIRDQRIGAMALFILLTVTISALLSAAFTLYEPLRTLDYADTYLRYAAIVAPIACLGVGMLARVAGRSRKTWIVPLAVALLVLVVQFVPQAIQRDGSRAWLSVDKGYSTPTVNITTSDVPQDSALLTLIYVPARFDQRIEGLYLISHFDPSINAPFVNLYYRN
jgi:Dolichyl-phosphate-mannose-protein mannosyltransferase